MCVDNLRREQCQRVGGIAFPCCDQGWEDLAVFSLCFGYMVPYVWKSPSYSGKVFYGSQRVSPLSEGLTVSDTEGPCNMLGMVRSLLGLAFIVFLPLLANSIS